MKMIVHNGRRYRLADAKRFGIPVDEPTRPKPKRKVKQKARTVEDEPSGADS